MPLLLLFALVPAFLSPVSGQCILSGAPRLIRAEGLAEPLGEIVLQCRGGAPGSPVTGALQITLDSRIGNRVAGEMLPDVKLEVASGSAWLSTPLQARLSGNAAVFENLSFNYDGQGLLGLRISGLRGEAAAQVRGYFSFLSASGLAVPSPVVLIGLSEPSFHFGYTSAGATPAPDLPAQPVFDDLRTLGLSGSTTRVTEAQASAFGEGRILIRYANVPPEATVLLPDAVAGSSALTPTSLGQMALPPAAGAWQSGLLLVRVKGANANGEGGVAAYQPAAGLNQLGAYSSADVDQDVPYGVYEVRSSDPAVREFAEVPAFFALPSRWRGQTRIVKPRVLQAPLSELRGPSETAPVPRFREATLAADCPSLGDCNAAYFPRITFDYYSGTTPTLTVPAGTNSATQYAAIRNDEGSLAEWRVFPRYKTGSGWLRLFTVEGTRNSAIGFAYNATGLTPGFYEADLVAQITNGPSGLVQERTLPLRLEVSSVVVSPPKPEPPAPEPPAPLPKPAIRDVVNAANRIPGPIAPSSLVLITGDGFLSSTTVTFAGLSAPVLSASATELFVEAPAMLVPGTLAGVVVSNAGQTSGVFGIDVATVAPAIVSAINHTLEPNSSGFPATIGQRLILTVTGIRQAMEVTARIHDRFIDSVLAVAIDPPAPGVDRISFVIPADLPAMSTAVTVCAKEKPGATEVCAEPFDVWIQN